MAAQERARLAEQKEKEAKAAAQAEIERKQREEEEAKQRAEEAQRIQKAQSALRSAAGHALVNKQEEIFRQLEGKGVSPEIPTKAVPIMKSMDTPPPPPPFDAVKFAPPPLPAQQLSPTQTQPPSFDFVEQQMIKEPSAPSPSAPPITTEFNHLEGVMPMAPPSQTTHAQVNMPPPPSFAEFEQHQQSATETADITEDVSFDFDMDGVALSPEERHKMMEEQRQLYENIMKEKAANDAAIAQASADAFDFRSSSAAVKAMERNTQAMDSLGRDLVGKSEKQGRPKTEGEETGEDTTTEDNRRFVKIGNNQTVALHGQDRTKKAIKDGTAILVQCMNCQNWMQVTETATLMFCPVCQVVSPVVKQNEVLTKEEAIQLTMDRKLAEKLQAEAYASDGDDKNKEKANESGYFAKLFGGGSTEASTAASPTAAGEHSWWDKISSIVSYGVEEVPRERGELGVTRPPGASNSSTYPGQRREHLSPVNTVNNSTSPSRNEETRGLLSPAVVDGNEANLPAGRVAEQRPLFSCVMDSVSNVASAVFSTGDAADEEGNVYGVDSSSLLAVTSAGRGVGDGAGDYAQLENDEEL
jgi:hypothetical protein|eukprot:scaffold224_cov181-Alexandrium_tamarense.AAC.9